MRTAIEICGTEERLERLWELRTAGVSWAKIAKELQLSQKDVQIAYRRQLAGSAGFRRAIADNAKEEHILMVERILEAHFESALKKDRYSSQFALQALDQRAKLLGLYPKGDGNDGQGGTTIHMTWNQQTISVSPNAGIVIEDHDPLDSGDIVQGQLSPGNHNHEDEQPD